MVLVARPLVILGGVLFACTRAPEPATRAEPAPPPPAQPSRVETTPATAAVPTGSAPVGTPPEWRPPPSSPLAALEWPRTRAQLDRGCDDPRALLGKRPATAPNRDAVAAVEVLRVFSEFRLVAPGAADDPGEVSLHDATARGATAEPPGVTLVARCGDAATCRYLLMAFERVAGHSRVDLACGPSAAAGGASLAVAELEALQHPFSVRSEAAACARVRACQLAGSVARLRCDLVPAEPVARCAEAPSCDEVVACARPLESVADRARPAEPQPEAPPPGSFGEVPGAEW